VSKNWKTWSFFGLWKKNKGLFDKKKGGIYTFTVLGKGDPKKSIILGAFLYFTGAT
jgi:hypothetical protein